jgi:hypothetical protein
MPGYGVWLRDASHDEGQGMRGPVVLGLEGGVRDRHVREGPHRTSGVAGKSVYTRVATMGLREHVRQEGHIGQHDAVW